MKESFGKKLVLRGENKTRIVTINNIIEDYQSQGYKLTLRQLYYQLVSRDIIPNKIEEYTKLSTLLNKGRMSGFVDWDAIVDRTRNIKTPWWEESPQDAVQKTINIYKLNRHEVQDNYIELWLEKDALSEIIYRATQPYGISLMVNRGYSSCSAMYQSYQRLAQEINNDKNVVIFYLGDHDPSGLDMIRDIRDRLSEMLIHGNSVRISNQFEYIEEAQEWLDIRLQVKPIALTSKQVRDYNPPPNPAKLTDPRATKYVEEFGYTSWEVDALNPKTLDTLVKKSILEYIDIDKHNEVLEQEEKDKEKLEDLITKL